MYRCNESLGSWLWQVGLTDNKNKNTKRKILIKLFDWLTGLTSIFIGIGEILTAGILFWKNQDSKRCYLYSIIYSLGFIAYFVPILRLPVRWKSQRGNYELGNSRWITVVLIYNYTPNFLDQKESLPHECPLRDSYNTGLIEPNGSMLMFCAFIYGFLDGTLNTQLIAMIGNIFPSEKDSAGAFVVWNLG